MKRLACIVLTAAILSFSASLFTTICTNPDHFCDGVSLVVLRAGGGSGGGGGGGGGGSHHSPNTNNSDGETDAADFVSFALFGVFAIFGSAIVLRFSLFRHSRNSKKLLKLLSDKHSAWKYQDIHKQVNETYHIVQKSWTQSDMSPARGYMSDELYESFCTKLNWMDFNNERNVLKMITLLDAAPISVFDSDDDSEDYVWFYISGMMIDYTVNTQTKQRIKGNILPTVFVEYWQFVRKENRRWVLNEILQKNEVDRINFTETQ